MPAYTVDNFYLDGGIVQEFLPDNIINANLRGYTTFFNKNMPASYVGQSLNQYFQRGGRPDIVEVIQNTDQGEMAKPTQADSDFEKRLQALLGIIGAGTLSTATGIGVETTLPATTEVAQSKSELCKDLPSFAIPFCNFATESGKRIALVLVGIVLLAIGIWSLR